MKPDEIKKLGEDIAARIKNLPQQRQAAAAETRSSVRQGRSKAAPKAAELSRNSAEDGTAPTQEQFNRVLEANPRIKTSFAALKVLFNLLRNDYYSEKERESLLSYLGFDRSNLEAFIMGLFNKLNPNPTPRSTLKSPQDLARRFDMYDTMQTTLYDALGQPQDETELTDGLAQMEYCMQPVMQRMRHLDIGVLNKLLSAIFNRKKELRKHPSYATQMHLLGNQKVLKTKIVGEGVNEDEVEDMDAKIREELAARRVVIPPEYIKRLNEQTVTVPARPAPQPPSQPVAGQPVPPPAPVVAPSVPAAQAAPASVAPSAPYRMESVDERLNRVDYEAIRITPGFAEVAEFLDNLVMAFKQPPKVYDGTYKEYYKGKNQIELAVAIDEKCGKMFGSHLHSLQGSPETEILRVVGLVFKKYSAEEIRSQALHLYVDLKDLVSKKRPEPAAPQQAAAAPAQRPVAAPPQPARKPFIPPAPDAAAPRPPVGVPAAKPPAPAPQKPVASAAPVPAAPTPAPKAPQAGVTETVPFVGVGETVNIGDGKEADIGFALSNAHITVGKNAKVILRTASEGVVVEMGKGAQLEIAETDEKCAEKPVQVLVEKGDENNVTLDLAIPFDHVEIKAKG